MAFMYAGKILKDLRARRHMTREELAGFIEEKGYAPAMYRLEIGELIPHPENLKVVFGALGVDMGEALCPHLDNQPMSVYVLRYALTQALDNDDLQASETLFEQLSAIGNFKEPVNIQFFLSQKARLTEIRGGSPEEIIPVVLEGIKQTYEEFDENAPGENLLIFEEPELFHTLARQYARQGRANEAVRILRDTFNGLQKLSTGERERDRRAVPILLTLSRICLGGEMYEDALKVCDMGLKISAMRSLGQGSPEFLWGKVEALIKLNKPEGCDSLLRQAYAGYLLLGEKEKACAVLAWAEEYGLTFNTYGMEKAEIPPREKVPYAGMGDLPECRTIGELIQELRLKAGLSYAQLCEGICSKSNLEKIEKYGIETYMNVYHTEPLMQRLGRDPLLYCNFFLKQVDFEARELQDLIHLHSIHRKYDLVAELLERLKTYKAYSGKYKINLQFIKSTEIDLFVSKHGYEHPDVRTMLLEAMRMTRPKFDESRIELYPLTHTESILVNMLAIHYMQSGDLKSASKIYEALIYNLNRRYVDEFEKARMYATVMFNLSSCLGRMGRRHEALRIIEAAERFERDRGRLTELCNLIYNRAYNYYMLGEKEKSLPYFAIAYYSGLIFADYGRAENLKIARNNVKKFFDIELD